MKRPELRIRAVLVSVLAVLGPGVVPATAQTHWEAYRNWDRAPWVDQGLDDPVVHGAVDLHAHHGPDAYPRQWDAFEVAEMADRSGIRAIVLKNHWTDTAGLAHLVKRYTDLDIEVFGGIALNAPVGGVNPQAVRYMMDVTGGRGRIVWMPTHDSEHEVDYDGDERPFVRVSEDGTLLPETIAVLELIAANDLTLATGHVTPSEVLMIMREARRLGIARIIVTHPFFEPQYTAMSMAELEEAADLGGLIEITARLLMQSDAARDGAIAVLRTIGPERCFVSSDSGLPGTPSHPEALALAAGILREAGFSEDELITLFQTNPARLVGLPRP